MRVVLAILLLTLGGCAKTGFDACVEHHAPDECARYYHTPRGEK